jgi:hypothetical protein
MIILAVALQLVVVHMIDGREVTINPDQVTHMSEANRTVDKDKQLADGVHCVIFFSDKSYLSTDEKCVDIVNRATKTKKP